MEDTREKVGPGKFVEYSYKLYNDADGSLLFETPKDAPDEMVFGVTPGIVPGLLTAMEGLGKGDRFEVTLPPVAAFGDKNDDLIMTLDKEIFMRDGKLADEVKVGAMLPMLTADNLRVTGTVTEIGDKIKMDFNHPFAGLTVRYEGEIVEVRDATPDDLPQGGCCGGCGSGGCSSGECGEGCNC
ncbi:MAG: FKBP-type peptidyl-prolyl cis-trans isomerase [Muribaculaceae bacterium]|nr:FKBP-type peptidyl-prolyl cis-trans isomerase [Muribaculaceae bacterium]